MVSEIVCIFVCGYLGLWWDVGSYNFLKTHILWADEKAPEISIFFVAECNLFAQKSMACLGSAVPNLLIIKPRPVWLTENRSSNPRALYMHCCWCCRSEWSLPPLHWNPASLCLSSNSFLHPAILSTHCDRRLVVMLHSTSVALESLKLRLTNSNVEKLSH